MPDHGPTIVLVHVAFANTSSWSKVIPLLKAKGLSVVAVHCPLSSLADDVASVDRVIGVQDAPVLLVGHSWGGAIITESGNSAKVSGLVYIAAAAPDSGESFNEWWKGSPPAPGAPEIKPYGPGGYVALSAEGFRDHFGPDLPADEVAVSTRLRVCLPRTPMTKRSALQLGEPSRPGSSLGRTTTCFSSNLKRPPRRSWGRRRSYCALATSRCFPSRTPSRILSGRLQTKSRPPTERRIFVHRHTCHSRKGGVNHA
jgi:pimeloyl-ACP methyl ester carboxylesterase